MGQLSQPNDGTCISGGLTMLLPDGTYEKVIDANGNLLALATPDQFYAGSSIIPVSAATPSNQQCQQLCQTLAPLVAQKLLQASQIARLVYRPSIATLGVYASGAWPGGVGAITAPAGEVEDVTVNTYAACSENVAVDLVLAQPGLMDNLAARLGALCSSRIDSDLLSLYPLVTSLAAVGTAGTPLTDTVIGAAVTAILGASGADLTPGGEPIFIAVNAAQTFGLTVNISTGAPLLPVPWQGSAASVENIAATLTLANLKSDVSTDPEVWIIPSSLVDQTGSTPLHTHNLGFTPSALGLGFGSLSCLEAMMSGAGAAGSIFTSQAEGRFQNVCVRVAVVNSGAGAQQIFAVVLYGTNVIVNKRAIQINS